MGNSRANRAETKILYGVSSVGLGHVRRSLAIANNMRIIDRETSKIDWVCAEPASSFLRLRGENVLQVSNSLESLSPVFEEFSQNGEIHDMSKVARGAFSVSKRNYAVVRPYVQGYDVLIQDEYWDTLFSSLWDPNTRELERAVVITDFVQLKTSSLNPINRLVLRYANRVLKRAFLDQKLRIFADDETSLPQNGRVRSWVREKFVMVGPIVEELPCESKDELRKELFTKNDNRELVVFSLGGTSIARPLVDFLVRNAGWLSEKLGMQLALLSGPRIHVASTQSDHDNALTVIPFTLDAMKYFKASDCVVTQAGGSTLNEVASIGIPCVSIPIKGHWEQEHNADRFSRRFGFQILHYDELTRENVLDCINKAMSSPRYEPMRRAEAPKRAAELIRSLYEKEN